MDALVAALEEHAASLKIVWGWSEDRTAYQPVLYIDLSRHGQCSFHALRRRRPQLHRRIDRILAFCDGVLKESPAAKKGKDSSGQAKKSPQPRTTSCCVKVFSPKPSGAGSPNGWKR
jgi:hypothetical protein